MVYGYFTFWALEEKMKREEDLDELSEMIATKRNLAVLLDKMTEEIDIKAKQVGLKFYERTKLILQVDKIMNHKKS